MASRLRVLPRRQTYGLQEGHPKPAESARPEPPPRRKFVRFDFPPGASLDEIVKGIRELTERHAKLPERGREAS